MLDSSDPRPRKARAKYTRRQSTRGVEELRGEGHEDGAASERGAWNAAALKLGAPPSGEQFRVISQSLISSNASSLLAERLEPSPKNGVASSAQRCAARAVCRRPLLRASATTTTLQPWNDAHLSVARGVSLVRTTSADPLGASRAERDQRRGLGVGPSGCASRNRSTPYNS